MVPRKEGTRRGPREDPARHHRIDRLRNSRTRSLRLDTRIRRPNHHPRGRRNEVRTQASGEGRATQADRAKGNAQAAGTAPQAGAAAYADTPTHTEADADAFARGTTVVSAVPGFRKVDDDDR